MKVLGITGGVGAGKSTALTFLKECRGGRILMADEVGRELQKKGEKGYTAIVAHFGEGILLENGELDRAKLASIVFSDSKEMEVLNKIMHPMIRQEIIDRIDRAREEGTVPFLVLEAALFFEDTYEAFCDTVWFIKTDTEVRISRLEESRGYTREKALSMIAAQMSDEEYTARCDFVVDNSNDREETERQLDEGLRKYEIL